MEVFAVSQTVTAHIDRTYVGSAVRGNYNLSNDDDFYKTFNKVDLLALLPACYIIPFAVVLVLFLMTVCLAIMVSCILSDFKENYYESSMKPLFSEVSL